MPDETPYKTPNRTPKTPFNIRLGRSIRNRRRSLGMSRKTLASYCGRSVSQLARYERGEVSITMDILIKIALHTGVHVDFYLFLSDTQNARKIRPKTPHEPPAEQVMQVYDVQTFSW